MAKFFVRVSERDVRHLIPEKHHHTVPLPISGEYQCSPPIIIQGIGNGRLERNQAEPVTNDKCRLVDPGLSENV